MEMGLKGKRVLITGSAGGFGCELAKVLAEEGANLVLHGIPREEDRLKALKDELSERYLIEADFVCADLSQASEAERLFAKANERMPLDRLVNNAGVWPTAYVREMTAEDFSKTLAINLTAPFILCREAVNKWVEQGIKGKIVNMVSQAAFHGSTSGHAHYAASKAGLVGFSISLAREVAPLGINVNCAAPGMMRTPMNREALSLREDEYLKRIPLGRIAEPRELAYTVAFLLGNKSDYITGATIDLTGGMLMR